MSVYRWAAESQRRSFLFSLLLLSDPKLLPGTCTLLRKKGGLSVAAGANPPLSSPPLMACKNGPSRKKPPKKRKKGLRSREGGGRAASSVTRREGRGSHEKSGRGKQRAAAVKKEAKNHGCGEGEKGEKEERFLSGDIGVKIGRNDLGRQKKYLFLSPNLCFSEIKR